MNRDVHRPPVPARALIAATATYLIAAAVLLISTCVRLGELRQTLKRLSQLTRPVNTAARRITDALPAADQRLDTR